MPSSPVISKAISRAMTEEFHPSVAPERSPMKLIKASAATLHLGPA